MDRGAWQATVYGVARVGHNSVTKQLYGCKHWSDGGQGGRKTLSLFYVFITISDHVIVLLVLNI